MEPESFFHVAFKVENIDECTTFYRERFGAEVVERGESGTGNGASDVEYVGLAVADKWIYFFDQAPYEAAGLIDDLPLGFLHFGLVVDDVEESHHELTETGVDFIMEPSVFGDHKIAFFTDPAGNRTELLEYL